MIYAKLRGVATALTVTAISLIVLSHGVAKDTPSQNGVRCCGLLLRTDFGHPDRMAELAETPDSVLGDCIGSGKAKGLVEAFDAYLEAVEKEFGEASRRDVVRSRQNQVFKKVMNDQTRTANLLEGYRQFVFAKVLAVKGLTTRSIEEARRSRTTFLRAVPAESFFVMIVDIYLATILADNGDSVDAVQIARAAVAKTRATYGKNDELVAVAVGGLAKVHLTAGQPKLAEEAVREALGILAESLELQPNIYLVYAHILAEALIAQNENAQAAELLAYLEPQIHKLFREQPLQPLILEVVAMRAKALVGLGRFDEAENVLGRYPEMTLSLKEPGIAGRKILEAYVAVLEKTDRANQTAPAKKCIARIDAKIPATARR